MGEDTRRRPGPARPCGRARDGMRRAGRGVRGLPRRPGPARRWPRRRARACGRGSAATAIQVVDLRLGRDQQRVDRVPVERVEQAHDGLGIDRPIPDIRRQLEDVRAARRAAPGSSFGFGSPYSWTATVLPCRSIGSQDVQDFGGGVRRRRGEVDAHAELSQDGRRLRTADDDGGARASCARRSASRRMCRAASKTVVVPTPVRKMTTARSRVEDALQWMPAGPATPAVDLAQARRGQRHAVVALDQVGQLGRATALQERNHALLQIGHAPSSPPAPAGMRTAPRASPGRRRAPRSDRRRARTAARIVFRRA